MKIKKNTSSFRSASPFKTIPFDQSLSKIQLPLIQDTTVGVHWSRQDCLVERFLLSGTVIVQKKKGNCFPTLIASTNDFLSEQGRQKPMYCYSKLFLIQDVLTPTTFN